MAKKNIEIHEGSILRRYVKANFRLDDVWKRLGYTSRQGLYFQFAKEKLSKDFIFLVQERLGVNVDEVLQNSSTPTNMGNNILHIKNVEKEKQISDISLDIETSKNVHLSPVKKLKILTDNNQIELQTFEALLPTRENKNGWLPLVDLRELYHLKEKRDLHLNHWPMVAEELYRIPDDMGEIVVTAPPYDNMIPAVFPNEKRYVRFIKIDDYKPSVPYVVGFKDKSIMSYYLARGNSDKTVRLISHDKSFGEKEELKENIVFLLAVSPR